MSGKRLSAVSPDGVYGLKWNSDGCIQIILMETGEDWTWLVENYPHQIEKAVFSHDMRRILCLNKDGSVGAWIIPRKSYPACPAINIVDYLNWQREYIMRRTYNFYTHR